MLQSRNETFTYPLEYAKDKKVIGTKEIYGEWAWGNFLEFSKGDLPRLPCKGIHIHPQLPLHEVKVYLTPKFFFR